MCDCNSPTCPYQDEQGFTVVELIFTMAALAAVGCVGYVIVHFLVKWW